MSELSKMIDQDLEPEDMAVHIDNLPLQERIREMADVGHDLQKKLFYLARTGATLEGLMPSGAGPLQEVIFYGRNSLPAFNSFQKRMCWSGNGTFLIGYNHQGLQWLTGPGYYTLGRETDRAGELMVDYTRVPTEKVAGWPTIRDNNSGIGRLVFGRMKDYLRQVSKTMFIGEATKDGKSLDQFFILCRE